MKRVFTEGDCVAIPDERTGRVRAVTKEGVRVRVRRKTSNTHQFLTFPPERVKRVACPVGWMSPDGYRRYLQVTLKKMRQRRAAGARARSAR